MVVIMIMIIIRTTTVTKWAGYHLTQSKPFRCVIFYKLLLTIQDSIYCLIGKYGRDFQLTWTGDVCKVNALVTSNSGCSHKNLNT